MGGVFAIVMLAIAMPLFEIDREKGGFVVFFAIVLLLIDGVVVYALLRRSSARIRDIYLTPITEIAARLDQYRGRVRAAGEAAREAATSQDPAPVFGAKWAHTGPETRRFWSVPD